MMKAQTLGVFNLLALVLLYLGFVPYNDEIAQVIILLVAILLLMKRR